jgi:hypothetical protein
MYTIGERHPCIKFWSGSVLALGEHHPYMKFWSGYVQGCGSILIFSGSGSSILGWTPIRIQIQGFNDQKLKILQLKIFFCWSKTAIYLSLGLHKVCPSYKRSLQLSKEAIKHFKTWTFTNFCLFLWVIFALLDPDPDSESGSGSKDPGYVLSIGERHPFLKFWSGSVLAIGECHPYMKLWSGSELAIETLI